MKFIPCMTASLALWAGAFAPAAFADPKGHGEKHGDRHGESQDHGPRKNEDRNAREQGPSRQSRYEEHAKRSPRESHDWQRDRGWERNGGWRGHDDWNDGRSHHWQDDHRTWSQRGGYRGYYVPWITFSLFFGSRNTFRIQSRPEMDHGYPRFRHRGQNFLIVDPWPGEWEDDWYESDDVYIEYDDGYYLHNRRHSGYALSIVVVD